MGRALVMMEGFLAAEQAAFAACSLPLTQIDRLQHFKKTTASNSNFPSLLQDIRLPHLLVVVPEPRPLWEAARVVRPRQEAAQDLHRVGRPQRAQRLRKHGRRVQGGIVVYMSCIGDILSMHRM